MIKLSVVIITYNEEKNIGRCIDSVKPVADDIVVVDSQSTDNTVTIAEQKGTRVIEHAFEGYIKQKNLANSHAKYPHILSLDADEVLSAELQDSIRTVKSDWKHDGYYMNRLTNYCGKWIRYSGWYPDKKLRLWDSRKGQWEGHHVHEKYEMQKGCTFGFLKGDLLHYSYNSISDHIKRTDHYSNISAKEYYEKGKSSSWFKIVVKPGVKFFRDYILKQGFRDGFYGLVVCCISAFSTFLKYARLWQLQHEKEG